MRRLILFGSMGAPGSVTNIAIFAYLISISTEPTTASALAFMVAVSQNFILNKFVTFRKSGLRSGLIGGYINYFFVNLGGLSINIAVLTILLKTTPSMMPVNAQLIGIALGMAFNYTLSTRIVFKR